MKYVVILSTVAGVQAWWDHGHMLVANIAKKFAKAETVEFFTDVLKLWENEFPQFTTFESGAVWLDHMKTKHPEPYSILGEDFNLLDPYHYINYPYNPANLTPDLLSDTYAFLPVSESGAFIMLRKAIRNLAYQPKTSATTQNIFLRSILHVVGDIHQPLHTRSALCRWFNNGVYDGEADPNADLDQSVVAALLGGKPTPARRDRTRMDVGGNMILMSNGMNLHAYWDSVANTFVKNYPVIDPETKADITTASITADAERLIKAHPDVVRGEWKPINTDDILGSSQSKDSFAFKPVQWMELKSNSFPKTIYGEIDETCASGRDFSTNPYTPSEEYTQNLKTYSEKAIVLGGIRLAAVLDQILMHRQTLIQEVAEGMRPEEDLMAVSETLRF